MSKKSKTTNNNSLIQQYRVCFLLLCCLTNTSEIGLAFAARKHSAPEVSSAFSLNAITPLKTLVQKAPTPLQVNVGIERRLIGKPAENSST